MPDMSGVETLVSSKFIKALVKGLGDFEAETLQTLKRYDIDVAVDSWYSQNLWIEALRDISERVGPTIMYLAGARILENLGYRELSGDFHERLKHAEALYQTHHRGGNFGSLRILNIQNGEAKIVSDTPYPCDFERGILISILASHAPDEPKQVWVVHENLKICRKKGFANCTYVVKWKPKPVKNNSF
ncbi:hypothetical protein KEJ51_06320 [Candidatus Bathyarchaeota archaeon]|nr:hypothetical protein [Candidatus Bathyarchaeota archaeon]MBS7628578.1 hypothetical protein [Candidatus Bathyarchaeota archaeon]